MDCQATDIIGVKKSLRDEGPALLRVGSSLRLRVSAVNNVVVAPFKVFEIPRRRPTFHDQRGG
jgi:hypothetical protein